MMGVVWIVCVGVRRYGEEVVWKTPDFASYRRRCGACVDEFVGVSQIQLHAWGRSGGEGASLCGLNTPRVKSNMSSRGHVCVVFGSRGSRVAELLERRLPLSALSLPATRDITARHCLCATPSAISVSSRRSEYPCSDYRMLQKHAF